MTNEKIYKLENYQNSNMNPGNLQRLPDESFVFIDAGFLSKLNKYFGEGLYLKYDIIKLADRLCEKQRLICKKVYYYTAPPFQSTMPSKEEEIRKKNYDKFVKQLLKNKNIMIREGRCQRLKIDNLYEFSQKAVDSLAIIDLMEVPLDHPQIKKIVLVACDSDFVPVIKKLEEKGIKTILYTYYQKSRDENFSTSNQLIKCVWKYVILTKVDFDSCPLDKMK